MKKFTDSRRFWALLYLANVLSLATAEYAPLGLLNALAAFLCVLNFNMAANE